MFNVQEPLQINPQGAKRAQRGKSQGDEGFTEKPPGEYMYRMQEGGTMNISWWRSWHGAPTDHKWAVIAARSGTRPGVVSAVAWAMLDYASQQPDRGSIAGFDPEEYAVFSGFSEDEIKAIIQAMTDKGIIVNGRFANWEKRQPKREDDSNERVRKFREMKRNVTQCNADDSAETPQIKIQIKDTDKEEEEEEETPPPPQTPIEDIPDGDLAPYEKVFVEETQLPPLSGGVERWFEGLKKIKECGGTPEDFRAAIREQTAAANNGKHYNLTSPVSFVNAVMNIVARRNIQSTAPPTDPAAQKLAARRQALYGHT